VAALRLLKREFSVPQNVLVCAPTHIAVDHILASCLEAGLKPLRIGSHGKVNSAYECYTLEAKLADHELMRIYEVYARKRANIDREFMRLTGRSVWMSRDDKAAFAALPKDVRKVAGQLTFSFPFLCFSVSIADDSFRGREDALVKEYNKLWNKMYRLKRLALEKIVAEADICLSTCIGASHRDLEVCFFLLIGRL
jgi:hypothetical protein